MLSLRRYHIIIFLTVFLIATLSFNALAVNDIDSLNVELDKQQQETTLKSGNVLWLDFLKIVVVLVLIVGAAWAIIRLFSQQVASKMQGTWINVVDEVTLGQNRGIVLCEVGERLYAIGVTDNNINFLFEIDNPKLLEEISFNDNVEKAKSTDWSDIKDFVKEKFLPNKTSPKYNKKEFHFLMDEQIKRIEKLSNDLGNNEMIIKRSDRND